MIAFGVLGTLTKKERLVVTARKEEDWHCAGSYRGRRIPWWVCAIVVCAPRRSTYFG